MFAVCDPRGRVLPTLKQRKVHLHKARKTSSVCSLCRTFLYRLGGARSGVQSQWQCVRHKGLDECPIVGHHHLLKNFQNLSQRPPVLSSSMRVSQTGEGKGRMVKMRVLSINSRRAVGGPPRGMTSPHGWEKVCSVMRGVVSSPKNSSQRGQRRSGGRGL